MAEAGLLHVAESLLGKLAPYAFNEIKSCWGAKDDLQRLVSSIRMIKAGLLDAEKRQERRDQAGQPVKEWLRRLRNVLYDAEDLFDEVIAIEESKQTLAGVEKFATKLSQLFSKSNPALFLADIAGRIKNVRKELVSIKSDMDHFKFDHGLSEKTMFFERETGSVKAADDVIGREEEEKELMGFLLDATSKEEGSVDVVAIVGFGGLGKTTLAQLLYNNAIVKEKFELRSWACISDAKQTTPKARIILDALQTTEKSGSSGWSFRARNVHEISVNELELDIHGRIQNKKYLLVLDDFWDEDPETWLYLEGLLKGGKAGSKILVTTRSSKVAVAMGVEAPHYLKGLADDKAWELFKRLAFRSTANAENRSLIMMGKEVVKKCKNGPLAIKAIASLLYTFRGNETEWKSIMNSDMLTLGQRHENLKILPVLKLSYDHLPSHLKRCFAFCSVFPKDYFMRREMLVDYWIAQGYVVEGCSDGGQSGLAKTGESCLKELTARSLLEQKSGGTLYYMHDLMHDLAQAVAGEEVFAADRDNCKTRKMNHTSNDVRIRHMSFNAVRTDDDLLTGARAKYLRSFIRVSPTGAFATRYISKAVLKKSATQFSSLRLLDVRGAGLERLPSSVGVLKHLRCLLISENRFRHLPDEICKLYNLMILDVSGCYMLEALPDNLNRLINLKFLRLRGSRVLRGSTFCKIAELSRLESLDYFTIRDNYSDLEAVTRLVNLRGRLDVIYKSKGGGRMRKEEEKRVDLSSSLEHLDELRLCWRYGNWGEGVEFECSQLPSNLQLLRLTYFPGRKLPEWKNGFNNLLHLQLCYCEKCRYLPSFGQYPRLRTLWLNLLPNLEYVQSEVEEFVAETHFPCLEDLVLNSLPILKAWSPELERRGLQHQQISSSAAAVVASFPRFHSLDYLHVLDCPELTSVPLPPTGKAHRLNVDNSMKEPLHTLIGPMVPRRTTVQVAQPL